MKKNIVLCFFVGVFAAGAAFAQGPTVVVIPLNTSKKVIANGYSGRLYLTKKDTYVMSGTNVSLPVDGTCVVTATGYVGSLDTGDTVQGPFFRTAQQAGWGIETLAVDDGAYGAYPLYVGSGSFNSTAVSATFAWNMIGGNAYRFGCAFMDRPTDWADDTARCRITWVCSAN